MHCVTTTKERNTTVESAMTVSPRVVPTVRTTINTLTAFVSSVGAATPSTYGKTIGYKPVITSLKGPVITCVVSTAVAMPASTGSSIMSRCVVGIALPTAVNILSSACLYAATSSVPSSNRSTLSSIGLLPVMVVITGATITMSGMLT